MMKAVWAGAILLTPMALLADVSGNVVLKSVGTPTNANLETGTAGTSGGDLHWDGANLTPLGNAKIRVLGVEGSGSLGFGSYQTNPPSFWVQAAETATSDPVPLSRITSNTIMVAITNGGSTTKIFVNTVTSLPTPNGGTNTSIGLRYVTFTGLAPGVPIIDSVVNNSSGVQPGSLNYGIAPSSLFVIGGAYLADPGAPVLQSSASPGLPLKLNGASISVTVNGVTVTPAIYYTSPNQIAAVLPARTPVGVGTITVTYNGKTGAPAPITVVASALGLNFYWNELGVVTDAVTGAIITYMNSAQPGEILTVWATGLGADPADSDTTLIAAPNSVNTPLQMFFGAAQAAILYQGSSQYPGVNQINITVPQSTPNGCWISLNAVAGGVFSNSVLIPVNAGGGECADPSGVTGSQIQPGGPITVRAGLVDIVQTVSEDTPPVISTNANASFQTYRDEYYVPRPSPGSCTVNAPDVPAGGAITGLGPGAIKLTGPNNLNVTMQLALVKGAYTTKLTAIPAEGATYTFAGAGGPDVGPFSTSVTFTSPLFSWTNKSAAAVVNKSQGITVTWSGGNPGSFVYIGGAVKLPNGGALGRFTCTANVADGSFTVPPSILMAVPSGQGGLELENGSTTPFSVSGVDGASAGFGISISQSSTFQ